MKNRETKRVTMVLCLPTRVVLEVRMVNDDDIEIVDADRSMDQPGLGARAVSEAMNEDDFDELSRLARGAR